jgi:hypothetical protein
MQVVESTAPGKPTRRRRLGIVFICALLGAGAGLAVTLHKGVLDPHFRYRMRLVPYDEQDRAHPEALAADRAVVKADTSIRVFGRLVYEEEGQWGFGENGSEDPGDLIRRGPSLWVVLWGGAEGGFREARELHARFQRYRLLIRGGFTLTGLLVGTGLGFCLTRLLRPRA